MQLKVNILIYSCKCERLLICRCKCECEEGKSSTVRQSIQYKFMFNKTNGIMKWRSLKPSEMRWLEFYAFYIGVETQISYFFLRTSSNKFLKSCSWSTVNPYTFNDPYAHSYRCVDGLGFFKQDQRLAKELQKKKAVLERTKAMEARQFRFRRLWRTSFRHFLEDRSPPNLSWVTHRQHTQVPLSISSCSLFMDHTCRPRLTLNARPDFCWSPVFQFLGSPLRLGVSPSCSDAGPIMNHW